MNYKLKYLTEGKKGPRFFPYTNAEGVIMNNNNTLQFNLNQIEDKINNLPKPIKENFRGKITISDLLSLQDYKEDDLFQVYKDRDKNGIWSEDDFTFKNESCKAGTFIYRLNNDWKRYPNQNVQLGTTLNIYPPLENIQFITKCWLNNYTSSIVEPIRGIKLFTFYTYKYDWYNKCYIQQKGDGVNSNLSEQIVTVPYAYSYQGGSDPSGKTFVGGVLDDDDYKYLKTHDHNIPQILEQIETINNALKIQADWNETNVNNKAYIKNKPFIPKEFAPIDANKNVQVDWNETNNNSDRYILNKPNIPNEQTVLDWGFTKNKGTIKNIKINGITKSDVNGIVDLGNVLTQHQDISNKQDKLNNYPAFNEMGSVTKIPVITTNNLGQVTNITEVDLNVDSSNDKMNINADNADSNAIQSLCNQLPRLQSYYISPDDLNNRIIFKTSMRPEWYNATLKCLIESLVGLETSNIGVAYDNYHFPSHKLFTDEILDIRSKMAKRESVLIEETQENGNYYFARKQGTSGILLHAATNHYQIALVNNNLTTEAEHLDWLSKHRVTVSYTYSITNGAEGYTCIQETHTLQKVGIRYSGSGSNRTYYIVIYLNTDLIKQPYPINYISVFFDEIM